MQSFPRRCWGRRTHICCAVCTDDTSPALETPSASAASFMGDLVLLAGRGGAVEQVRRAAAVGHEGHLLQQRHLWGHRQPQDGRGLRGGAQHRPHAGVCSPGHHQVAQAAALHRLRRLPLRLRQGLQCALPPCTMSHDTFKHMRKGLPVRLATTCCACSPLPAQVQGLLLTDLRTVSGDAPGSLSCHGAHSHTPLSDDVVEEKFLQANAFAVDGGLLAAEQRGGLQAVSL